MFSASRCDGGVGCYSYGCALAGKILSCVSRLSATSGSPLDRAQTNVWIRYFFELKIFYFLFKRYDFVLSYSNSLIMES